jgi:hypothetical protein
VQSRIWKNGKRDFLSRSFGKNTYRLLSSGHPGRLLEEPEEMVARWSVTRVSADLSGQTRWGEAPCGNTLATGLNIASAPLLARGSDPGQISIDQLPAVINKKRRFGAWEITTMFSSTCCMERTIFV